MSADDTKRIASDLAQTLADCTVLALHGELGSGKTVFVKGLAAALGIAETITSPTFTMINEYEGRKPLCHMDLYRIVNPDELLSLGLDEYFERPGVTAIEWAEKAGNLLPGHAIHVTFQTGSSDTIRQITVGNPNVEG